MCVDTVLCGGDTALVLSCAVKGGEFDTEIDTKSLGQTWVVTDRAG